MNPRTWAAALLDPDRPLPPGLRAWNGSDPTPRFAVHRNNVVFSLVAALGDAFPVCREWSGEAFFDRLAAAFVRRHPPSSPVLADWGDAFAGFVDAFEPAQAIPALADLARLEHARTLAFQAADAEPLAAQRIAAHLADPARLAGARLQLHPSLHTLRCRTAMASIWAEHQRDAAQRRFETLRPECAEAAWVLRDADEVLVLTVPPTAAAFTLAIAAGERLADAARDAAAARDDGPDFDLAATLGLLIRHGAIVAWQPGEAP